MADSPLLHKILNLISHKIEMMPEQIINSLCNDLRCSPVMVPHSTFPKLEIVKVSEINNIKDL